MSGHTEIVNTEILIVFGVKAKLYNGCRFRVTDVATEHVCSNTTNLYYGGAWFESRT
jgi:hypothetical protein